ncbi:hypothetical protein HYH02_014236 [Chlamydomonas schloesseri]|uniref:Uncharacterized protein n=1 Tax=Chlamydomonas schloesseri TaxID=2026947 RepID=A0A835SV53_9CHLO|nr:hypothetical protein HYH02_014236 [Chlamydomonas schloesseri]|eukprot:KAG2428824.1 hypothetical protein HYH02_014236 [Chlamydomonas schloesseri]
MRLACERGHLRLEALGALVDSGWEEGEGWEEEEEEEEEEGGHAAGWRRLFSVAAAQGAPLAVLRDLHERRGAAIDLRAMARGGCSVEALEWAVQALQEAAAAAAATEQADGLSLPVGELWVVACAGDFAAADWLCDRGLVSAPQQQLTPPPAAEPRTQMPSGWWLSAR